MTSTPVDLLAAISTHLNAFEFPPLASIHLDTSPPGPQLRVQLLSRGPATLAQGLLAWADTLTDITTHAWRVPNGNSVHLSVTGLLPEGITVLVYGGMRITHCGPGADLAPGATAPLPLGTLRHLATPGQITDEATL
jgi:hypothetical protein